MILLPTYQQSMPPATEISTVHEILRQTVPIKSLLNITKIAVVLDQTLNVKVTERVWNDLSKFKALRS